MRSLHELFAWFVIVANGVVGLWLVAAHWVAPLRSNTVWWALIVAQLSVFVQVSIGVYLVAVQGAGVTQFHMFYGFVCIVTIAILFAYRDSLRAHLFLLYGCGSLFVMGLAIRGMLLA